MEKGTLEELNVKAGDVVKRLEGTGIYFNEGQTETITDDMMINTKMGLLDVGIIAHTFTIVSRASDTPKLEGDSPTLWRDMTPEERGALLLAHHEGEVIEAWMYEDKWLALEPEWDKHNAYRIKPSNISEPKVETVKLPLHGQKFIDYVAIDMIDGEYDMSTVRPWPAQVEEL